ncbi:MAG: PorT family protein [Sphingobacteriales bacterium]|nr:MAG: PorT family protein [Sphingobacteriales bacterium]
MKKYTYILVIFSLFGTIASYAQNGLHVGIDGAFNGTFIINQNIYADMQDQRELDYAPTFGYTAGFAAGYNFGNHFGLQAEIKHSLQGQKYADVQSNINIDRIVRLKYTHIPVLFKFSGGGNYATRFYVMAGPQFSFLQSAHEKYSSATESYDVDRTNRFNNRDLQLVLDLGSDFVVYKNLYASTGLRFNYGLWDINADGFKLTGPSRTSDISQNALGGIHVGLHYVIGPPVEIKH